MFIFDGIFKDSPHCLFSVSFLSLSLSLFQTTPALARHSALLVPYNGVFVLPFVRRVILRRTAAASLYNELMY